MTVWASYHLSYIDPYDPPFRYLVNSFTGRDIYLVDLLNYKGNGQCDCKNFQCNMEPKLSRGAPPSDELRCKHIMICRVHAGLMTIDAVIERILKQERQST